MVIGAAEIGILAALFGLVTGVSTVIGNFYILRYQMTEFKAQVTEIKEAIHGTVQKVDNHEKRLIQVETVCHERHGGLV